MSTRIALGAITVSVLLLGVVASAPAARDGPPARPSARVARTTAVGLGMREWAITVYRPKVPVGTVRFLVTNRGEDVHDLRVRGPHGYRSAVSADAAPAGGRITLRTHLRRPGRYLLLCVKPGHEKLGMRATLRVVSP